MIDDQAAVLATMRASAEFLGHEVVTATRALNGINILKAQAFDLLMVDIFMPDMDGTEAIHVVRQHHPSLPILVMSGSSMGSRPDFLDIATRLGAVRGLRKPFKRAELAQAIDACPGDAGVPLMRHHHRPDRP